MVKGAKFQKRDIRMNKIIITKRLGKENFGVMHYRNKKIPIRVIYTNPFYSPFICARDCSHKINTILNKIGAKLNICKLEPIDENESYSTSEVLFDLGKARKYFDIKFAKVKP